jgi:drug/metabolite transporter (DMT)-like permease
MTASSAGSGWRVHLALVAVQLGFGGFHVVAKATLAHLHPLVIAGCRVLVAAPLLLAVAWAVDRVVPSRRDLPALALLGLLGVFTNQLLFILGLRLTTATNAAILMPSIPVYAAAVAILLGVERLDRRRVLGIALAVAGALVMLDPLRLELAPHTLLGNLLVLINCLSYATFLVLQRPMLQRLPVTTVIAWSFLFGGAGVAVVSAPWLAAVEVAAVPAAAWWGLVYIVLVPTLLSYWLNTWAISRSTPSLAATYITLQPLTAGLLAFIFLGERVGWPQLVGALLIVAGLERVAAANRRASRRAADREAAPP